MSCTSARAACGAHWTHREAAIHSNCGAAERIGETLVAREHPKNRARTTVVASLSKLSWADLKERAVSAHSMARRPDNHFKMLSFLTFRLERRSVFGRQHSNLMARLHGLFWHEVVALDLFG